jgi:hypothetical protein
VHICIMSVRQRMRVVKVHMRACAHDRVHASVQALCVVE